MADAAKVHAESGLPPPGSRWGTGAQSVLPYLTRSLQSRPSAATEPREPRAGQAAMSSGERGRPHAS